MKLKRKVRASLIITAMVAATANSAAMAAQASPGPVPPSPEFMAKMRVMMERFNAMPDTPGTGPYPALKEEDPSLANHVVYRPADLSRVASHSLGILAWGNGGCSSDGAGGRLHLAEIASHGYLAIANGQIKSGPGAPPQPPRSMPAPGKPMTLPPPETNSSQLTQAIDWAIAENGRKGSRYYGKINTKAVAVSGWSCGGLQALQIATSDPRVKAVIIHNSGIFPGKSPMQGMDIGKETLDRLHTPIIYILGGPTDIAYTNGMDDFTRITKVPAMTANLDRDHGGTFTDPNGGLAAQAATKWLDWQLKGDSNAGNWFKGKDCKLCSDPAWKVQRKGLD
ncbi:MAG: hypothetical protein JWP15_1009 [Alphaproteobacteria bacterium]|nr:hypothetical protein [Alphaproteobacteria bacterium]